MQEAKEQKILIWAAAAFILALLLRLLHIAAFIKAVFFLTFCRVILLVMTAGPTRLSSMAGLVKISFSRILFIPVFWYFLQVCRAGFPLDLYSSGFSGHLYLHAACPVGQ